MDSVLPTATGAVRREWTVRVVAEARPTPIAAVTSALAALMGRFAGYPATVRGACALVSGRLESVRVPTMIMIMILQGY